MRLDRAHWTLLAALHREGTLTGAAEALGVTQSAATQRLREAERRLGVALAERRGRAVSLNAAGLRLAEAGGLLERALGAAESDAIWIGRRSRARLRIAWSHYDAAGMAVALSELCLSIDDGVDLEFARAAEEDVGLMLRRNDADIAVLPYSPTLPGVVAEPLAEDHLVATTPAGAALAEARALAPEDFGGRPYLTYGLHPRAGWEYDRFSAGGRRFPETIVKVDSTELIASLVGAGAGFSILPARCVAFSASQGRIASRRLRGAPIRLTWWLHHRDADPPDAARRVAGLASLARRGFELGPS